MAKFKIATPAGASFTVAGGGYDLEMEPLEGIDAQIVEGPTDEDGFIKFAQDADAVYAHPAFAMTPAAANKAFISMEGLYLLGFGPRTAAAARDLSVKLYPALADQGGTFSSALSAANCRQ